MAAFYRQKHLFNETEESEGEENEFYQFSEAPDEFKSSPIMPQNNVKSEELKVADNTQKIGYFNKKYKKTNLVESEEFEVQEEIKLGQELLDAALPKLEEKQESDNSQNGYL